jgi:hypothetical protein
MQTWTPQQQTLKKTYHPPSEICVIHPVFGPPFTS